MSVDQKFRTRMLGFVIGMIATGATVLAAGSGEAVRIGEYGTASGPVALAGTESGFTLVTIGYDLYCSRANDKEHAVFRAILDRDGVVLHSNCTRRPTSVTYKPDTMFGGSLTESPAGYAFAWQGLGYRHYIESFEQDLEPVGDMMVYTYGAVSFYGSVGVLPPIIVGTSRSIVHLHSQYIANHHWLTKRRVHPITLERDLEGPVDIGTDGRGPAWNPYTFEFDAAWNGEHVAVAFYEFNDPENPPGSRLMFRLLDPDSQPLGPAKILERYPRGAFIYGVSIARTADGWAVARSLKMPGDEDDIYVDQLDREGNRLASRRITPNDGVNASGVGDLNVIIEVADNGNLGVAYPTRAGTGGPNALWFIELDSMSLQPLAGPRQLPVDQYELGNSLALAHSGERWGLSWQVSRGQYPAFTWYPVSPHRLDSEEVTDP